MKTKNNPFRFCCFDLETTNLNADYGVVLCSAYAFGDEKPTVISQRTMNPNWAHGSSNDKEVVKATLKILDQADFWVAHNGANFDIPFLYTSAAVWGLKTPAKRAALVSSIVRLECGAAPEFSPTPLEGVSE